MYSWEIYKSTPIDVNNENLIRVLEILDNGPPDGKIPIACALHVVNMYEVEYTALSYRWGCADFEEGILLNGCPFSVRANLWDFLDEAQLSNHKGYLWIDAMCIDQRDIQERSHQVALMGEIYSNASKVVVWLAKELSMDATPTISPSWLLEKGKYPGLCRKPVLRVLRDADNQLCNAMPDLLGGTSNEEQQLPSLNYMDSVIDGLGYLFSVEYWERIWIAQEYILAKEIELRVGPDSLNGETLSRLCKVMVDYQQGSVHDPKLSVASCLSADFARQRRAPRIQNLQRRLAFDVINRRDRWREYSMAKVESDPELSDHLKFWSLEQLLKTFSRSRCSEPRDHIYALLSLVHSKDMEVFNIKPDYTTTASELLVELAYGFYKLLGRQNCPDVIRPLVWVLGLDKKNEGYMVDIILDKVEEDVECNWRGRARDAMAMIKKRYIYEVDDYRMRVGQEWRWLIFASRLNHMYSGDKPTPEKARNAPAMLDLEESASMFASPALLSPTLDTVERYTAFL